LNELNIKYRTENEKTNDVPSGEIVRCSKDVGAPVSVETSEEIVVYIAVNYEEETAEAVGTATVEAGETDPATQEAAETTEE
ncbi:MAG: PASTA domain-containing protein, partial [Oscillospiraceae bacterium]|nr:PASTA domain-containing protein [Oscillospiraceae bacterium]